MGGGRRAGTARAAATGSVMASGQGVAGDEQRRVEGRRAADDGAAHELSRVWGLLFFFNFRSRVRMLAKQFSSWSQLLLEWKFRARSCSLEPYQIGPNPPRKACTLA